MLLLSLALAAQDPLLIDNATILSPGVPHHLEQHDILIEGGLIVQIAPHIEARENDNVLDATGRFVTPGLIDAHVHLYHATGLRRRYTDDFDRLYQAYMDQQPRSYLFHGFTTVVELNADPQANATFEAAPLHPNLIHCGRGVVLANGFMALDFSPEGFAEAFPTYLHDPHGGDALLVGEDGGDHTPRAVLDAIQAEGGQCVKLYYEQALWWPGGAPEFSLPSVEILRAVTDEAHRRGLPVFLHATTPAGFAAGLKAGVDIFAHGPWEWPQDGFGARLPGTAVQQTIANLAAGQVAVQPTIRSIRNTQSLFDPNLLDDPAWQNVVSADYLAYLRSDAQVQRDQFLGMFADAIAAEAPGQELAVLQANFVARYQNLVSDFSRRGGTLSFGTDTAVGGFGWGAPSGLAGYWEMLDWAEAGIEPETIFVAATSGNADLLGLSSQIGRVAVGLRADLLILRENPLTDIRAFDEIDWILRDGDPTRREDLAVQPVP